MKLPTVLMDEESKKYLERLRKRILSDKVPTLKSTVELVLQFVKLKEEEFIKWTEGVKF